MNKDRCAPKYNIWIDLDNSPHVPFFRPIISELARRNCATTVTSRECFETIKLLDFYNMPHKKIGKHTGKNSLKKIFGLLYRTFQLCVFAKNKNFNLAVCHGSRAQILASTILNIPVVLLFDYEGSKTIPLINRFLKIVKYMVPESLEDTHLAAKGIDLNKVCKYPGIKEDVYLFDFEPNPSALASLGLDEKKIIIVVRPPATQAHYHNPRADGIYEELLNKFSKEKNIQLVLLARTAEQQELAAKIYKTGPGVLTIPKTVLNGLDLIWQADLVISGGGTMVREGAGLGVPAYSIFCGQKPDIDRYLESQQRLVFVREIEDIGKIKLIKRNKNQNARNKNNLAPIIVDEILLCLK
jgi:uncharacterized protein